ncbi:hypothetical protein V8F33_012795 [Rhypophila sp. PSN 637]
MVLYGQGFQRTPTESERRLGMLTGMSPNYKGDPDNLFNYNNIFIEDHENCSFWLTNHPPDVTVRDVLSTVNECGRVYALHINREEIREQRGLLHYKTRCLRISGPRHLGNEKFLLAWLNEQFVFEIDEVIVHWQNHDTADIEIRFAAYRAQAILAFKAITQAPKFTNSANFSIRWVRDVFFFFPILYWRELSLFLSASSSLRHCTAQLQDDEFT